MFKLGISWLLAGAAAGAFISPPAAAAQTAPAATATPQATDAGPANTNGIEDIVVTAERHAEKIQKTPISMTAFSADTLAKMNASALNDIGNLTPNTLFNQNGGESIVFVRGIGQSDAVVTADPGVGIYVDGVYIPRLFGDSIDLLDIERVEVLRGPQGTLFGKNTIGGAISVTTKTPSLDTVSATIDGRVGSRSRLDAGGYLSLPLVRDSLAFSAAFSERSQGGYIALPNAGTKGGNTNRQTGRAKLYWAPSSTFTATLAGEFYRQREVGLATQLATADPNGVLDGLWNGLVGFPTNSPYAVSGLAPRNTSYGTGPYYDDIDVRGVSLTAGWQIGPGTLKSITAYRSIGRRAVGDVDAEPQPITRNPVDESSKTWSQELQYTGTGFGNRLRYVVGVYYLRERAMDSQSVIALTGLYQALTAAGMNGLATATDVTQNTARNQLTSSYAGYVNAGYELVDRLTLTLGARYSADSKQGHLYLVYPNSGIVGVDKSITQYFSSFTPKFGLNFQATPSSLFYASVAKGFKSGGINGRPTVDAAVQPYLPETVWNYELGAKTDWFDHRLRINLALFHMDYKDIQLQVASMTTAGALLLTIQNPGNARMNGFEGEVAVRPSRFLTLGGNVGYNDSRYKGLAADAPVTTSDQLIYNPKWSGAVFAEITVPVGGDRIELRADHSFHSKIYLDTANTESVSQPAYSLTSARLSYTTRGGRLQFYVYGTNLTDTYYKVFGIPQSTIFGWDAVAYAAPREVGVGARLSF